MFDPAARSTSLRQRRAQIIASMTTLLAAAQGATPSREFTEAEHRQFNEGEAEVNVIDGHLGQLEVVARAAAGARPIDSGLPGSIALLRDGTAANVRAALEASGLIARAAASGFVGRAELRLALRTLVGGGNDGVSTAPTALQPINGEAGVYNRISALVPHIPVAGSAMIYNRIKLASDSPNLGAQEQDAQGDEKARVLIDSDPLSATVKTWAGHEKLSTQVLEDAPSVAAVVESILRGSVLDVIDAHCYAVMTSGGNFTASAPSGSNVYENMLRILAQLRQRGSTNVVIAGNPGDLLTQSIAKASTSGNYLGRPDALSEPGVRVVESASVASGKLLGFDAGGNGPLIGDRASVTASLGLSDDDFIRNLRTMLVEARAVCVVRDPTKVVYGNTAA